MHQGSCIDAEGRCKCCMGLRISWPHCEVSLRRVLGWCTYMSQHSYSPALRGCGERGLQHQSRRLGKEVRQTTLSSEDQAHILSDHDYGLSRRPR